MKEMKNNWQTYLIKAIGFAFALCLLQLGFISSADAVLSIELEITKEWIGGEPVNVKPVEVKVVGTKAADSTDQNSYEYTFTLKKDDGWKETQRVAKNTIDGKAIQYKATEVTQVPDYISQIGEVEFITRPNDMYKCKITNTRPRRNMTIIKKWASPAPAGVNRVTVKVTASTEDGPVDLGAKGIFTITKSTNEDEWTETHDGFPITQNGKKITYTATEVTPVEGFTSSVGEMEEIDDPAATPTANVKKFQCVVTNSKTPLEPQPLPDEYRQMTLTKEWVGGEPDGVEEVLVKVEGRVEAMDQLPQDLQEKLNYTFRLTKRGLWTEGRSVFSKIRGQVVTYKITEVTEVPGYTSQVGELKLVDVDRVTHKEKGWTCTITNTRATEESARRPMEITKKWMGDATVDEVVIEAQGRVPGKDLSDNQLAALKYTFTLSKTNNWKAEQVVMSVWNGADVVYSLKELTSVPGYTSQVGELKLENVNKATHIEQKWTCTVTNSKTEESKSEPKPEPQPKPDETLGDDGTPTGNTELPKTDGVSASLVLLMGAMIVSGGYVLRKRK